MPDTGMGCRLCMWLRVSGSCKTMALQGVGDGVGDGLKLFSTI